MPPLIGMNRHHHLRELLGTDAGLVPVYGAHRRIALCVLEKSQLDVDGAFDFEQASFVIGNGGTIRKPLGVAVVRASDPDIL